MTRGLTKAFHQPLSPGETYQRQAGNFRYSFLLFCMGEKLGLSYQGKNIEGKCLKIRC